MNTPLDYPCAHCGAAVADPCLSVGGKIKVSPHMRRLDIALEFHLRLPGVVGTREEWMRAARALYETKVLIGVFGTVTDYIRARARKDDSIDLKKPWVLAVLRQNGKQPQPAPDLQGALL